MNSVLPSYPPVVEHSSTSITPSQAHKALSTYLETSLKRPSLHPDAFLTPAGVTFNAASGSQGNLTLSSLRRISRGLAGENLSLSPEALLELEVFKYVQSKNAGNGNEVGYEDGMTMLNGDIAHTIKRLREGKGLEGIGNSKDRKAGKGVLKYAGGSKEKRELSVAQEDWMDMQEYAETREVLEGDIDDRGAEMAGQGNEGEEPEIRGEEEVGGKRKLTAEDKEARKAEKKKRRKEELREKERIRAGK